MQDLRLAVRWLVPTPLATLVWLAALVGAMRAAGWQDQSPHRISFVGVEQGVALEVLDWGGSGPPMILLAGLGNTAHVFDEFALHFTDRFHVYGMTRRGYGASGRPSDGYDIGTLAHDIRVVCDRLNLQRVILVGHSLAGDEMTKFAATYPETVRALVYLDAAYDRTDMPPEGTGPPQNPNRADLVSIATYRDFVQRTRGMRMPESELRWTVVTDTDGRIVRGAIPSSTPQAILRGLERPDYAHVRAPALALYQPNRTRETFPNYDGLSDGDKLKAEKMVSDGEAFVERSMGQFRREVAQGKVVRLTAGSHYMFVTSEDEVVRLMRDFLIPAIR